MNTQHLPQLPDTDNEVKLLQAYAKAIVELDTDAPELTVRSMDVNLFRYMAGLLAERRELYRAVDPEDVDDELGDCYWFLARLATRVGYDFSYKLNGTEEAALNPYWLLDCAEKELRPNSRPRISEKQAKDFCAIADFDLELCVAELTDTPLRTILQNNIYKLAKRKAEGKISKR